MWHVVDVHPPCLSVTRSTILSTIHAVTGIPYNFSMLSFNFSQIGHFNPLIQQKRMQTGKAQGTMPMDMVQYKGLPFNNKTWGILNVTGIAEGTAFGIHVDPGQSQIEWDSALSRPLSLAYTGEYSYLRDKAISLTF